MRVAGGVGLRKFALASAARHRGESQVAVTLAQITNQSSPVFMKWFR